MARIHRTLSCALIALVAVAFSGCDWKGEGKGVAAAIIASSTVKTRAFTGSMTMDMSQMAGATAGNGSNGTSPGKVEMTFSGAIDDTDPANPKMVMKMSAEGQDTSMVAPGDGKFYITSGGKSNYVPVDPGAAEKQTINPQKIYVALGDAVGDFQKSPPITNARGKQVETTTAKVSKKKLCGPVLDAFGEAMSQSSGFTAGLGGGGSSEGSNSLGKDGKKMIQSFCQTMLKSDPRVWFGIDDGKLTDIALTAKLTIPFAGPMGIEVQYHEYDQDQPQTGFDVPAGATPMGDLNTATPPPGI